MSRKNEIAVVSGNKEVGVQVLPKSVQVIGKAGQQAWQDFFDGKLANKSTRRAYEIAVRQFLTWCEHQDLDLPSVMAGHVGQYLREHPRSLG